MEHFPITQRATGFHIEGFPDAVKVISIDGPKTKRLADLALHKADLEFAWECLEEINHTLPEKWIVRQSLWRNAIIHFGKCFGQSASRFQLGPDAIWKGNQSALMAFKYFKNHRNKHVVHDENSYAQSIPGAILNNGKKLYKIEKIVSLSVLGETLEQDNYSNLHLLIKTAKEWVFKEFDKLCENLTTELKKKSYDDLLKRGSINFQAPKLEDLGKNRNIPQ